MRRFRAAKAVALSCTAAAFAVSLQLADAATPLGEITIEATGGSTAGFSTAAGPSGITTGPDDLLWFLERSEIAIARLNADGTVDEFDWPVALGSMSSITTGPDGNLWLLDFNPPGRVGRVTPAGVVTEVATGGVTAGFTAGNVQNIIVGPDDNLWFTRPFVDNGVGRITTGGVVTQFDAPDGTQPRDIALASDGNMYVTSDDAAGTILRVTSAGVITAVATGGVTAGFTAGRFPSDITVGPDGNLWFLIQGGVARMTLAGAVTEFDTPTADPFLEDITSGCGSLWVTQGEEDSSSSAILRVTTGGVFTSFTTGLPAGSSPDGITFGPDDDVWFTMRAAPGRVAHIGAGCGGVAPTTSTTEATTTTTTAGEPPPAAPVPQNPVFTG
jgi:virginiamycin B lyase